MRTMKSVLTLFFCLVLIVNISFQSILQDLNEALNETQEERLDTSPLTQEEEKPQEDVDPMRAFFETFTANSKALYMYNLDEENAIYTMNAEARLPMASLTKIMTYIVAYENIEDLANTVFTVDASVQKMLSGTGSSVAGVVTGEELTGLELLYLLMLPSGNDVAIVLAQYIDAKSNQFYSDENLDYMALAYDMGESEFVRLMNEKAVELGLSNTHFTNPHGLHHENHYSTARDIAIIAEYALDLPYFKDIVASESYTLRATNAYPYERTYANTNALLSKYSYGGAYYYEYAKGMKTGYHSQAQVCIVSYAQKDEYSYIVVALGGPVYDENGEYAQERAELLDSINLFEWAFNNMENRQIISKGYILSQFQLINALDDELLEVASDKDINAFLHKEIKSEDISVKLDIENLPLKAPIQEGDILGTAIYSYNGEVIGTSNAVAVNTVHKEPQTYELESIIDLLFSQWSSIVGK